MKEEEKRFFDSFPYWTGENVTEAWEFQKQLNSYLNGHGDLKEARAFLENNVLEGQTLTAYKQNILRQFEEDCANENGLDEIHYSLPILKGLSRMKYDKKILHKIWNSDLSLERYENLVYRVMSLVSKRSHLNN